jgi:hypothetical protein
VKGAYYEVGFLIKMSIYIRNIAINAALIGFVFAPIASFAQGTEGEGLPSNYENGIIETVLKAEAVNLEIENPGLLSTNPFYFMKKLKRTTLRMLVFNAAKKAELELAILSEKTAEIKRLKEIMPDNSNALLNAAESYLGTLKQLQFYIRDLKNGENLIFDDLLNKLVNHLIKHLKFFDELKINSDVLVKEKSEMIQDELSKMAIEVLRIDGFDKFKIRFWNALENQGESAFKELRAAEIINHFEEKLAADLAERQIMSKLKEDLLLGTEAKIGSNAQIRSALPVILGHLPGDIWRRIKVLDEAREYMTDADFKNDLALARQTILDSAAQERTIGKLEAEKTLKEADTLYKLIETKLSGLNRRSPIRTAIARAEFNLRQAQELMRDRQYLQAFGQASTALAAAKNALNQLYYLDNLNNEIKELKFIYDRMIKTARDNGFTIGLLGQIEKSLAALSDSAQKKTELDEIISALRKVKVLLVFAESELESLLTRLAEEAEKKADESLLKRVLNVK